jgi:hypothetical protein
LRGLCSGFVLAVILSAAPATQTVDPQPQDATQAILTAFDRYDVVGLSAAHNNKALDDFILTKIPSSTPSRIAQRRGNSHPERSSLAPTPRRQRRRHQLRSTSAPAHSRPRSDGHYGPLSSPTALPRDTGLQHRTALVSLSSRWLPARRLPWCCSVVMPHERGSSGFHRSTSVCERSLQAA